VIKGKEWGEGTTQSFQRAPVPFTQEKQSVRTLIKYMPGKDHGHG